MSTKDYYANSISGNNTGTSQLKSGITSQVCTQIDLDRLPSIIGTQFTKLQQLDKEIEEAAGLACNAKEKAKNAQVSAGVGHKKEAILLLQDVANGLADGLISATKAQKHLFDYQKQLTEITKYLLALGVTSLAMNRCVVRELELRLKGASAKNISDLAKIELNNVIRQLKAQEDIMMKQDMQGEKLKEHNKKLEEIEGQLGEKEDIDKGQDDKIANNAKKIAEQDIEDEKQDEKIAQNENRLAKHDQRLNAGDEKDRLQDEEMKRQAAEDAWLRAEANRQAVKDEEHDQRLDAGDEKDRLQDEEMKRQAAEDAWLRAEANRQAVKDEEHDQRLDAGDEKDRLQDEEMKRQAEEDAWLRAEANRQAIKDEEHDRRLNAGDEKDRLQDEEMKRQAAELYSQIEILQQEVNHKGNKYLLWVTSASSVAALLLSILHFFL